MHILMTQKGMSLPRMKWYLWMGVDVNLLDGAGLFLDHVRQYGADHGDQHHQDAGHQEHRIVWGWG